MDFIWGMVVGMCAVGMYALLIDPMLRFFAQWRPFELIIYHFSWFTATPVPCSYGKWRVWAVFLGFIPIKVKSTKDPWSLGKDTYKEALQLLRDSPAQFSVEWD